MPELWLPGAERHPIGNTGAMEGGPSRVIWHATSNATTDDFRAHVGWFTGGGAGAAPHILWHPYTGELAQLFPANSRSLSVRNADDGTRTNRTGTYCIQVEVCFTKDLRPGVTHIAQTPCKNLHKLMAWFNDLGIEERWPGGEPTGWHRDTVSVGFWLDNGGHYGHHQVPGNDHVDPGRMPDLFSLGGGGEEPEPEGDEPAHDYTRVQYDGHTVNVRTREMLDAAAELAGHAWNITQGSYNPGGDPTSAGTHDGGGVVDIASSSWADARALREVGFAAWVRSPDEGNWGYHIHAVAIGDRELSGVAADQVVDYFNGRNALANNRPDTAPSSVGRPYPDWAQDYAPGGTPEPEPEPEGETYTVQEGDHLWGISVQYDVDLADLREWNDLPEGEPEPGTVLRLTAPAPPLPPFPDGLRPNSANPSAKPLQRMLKAAGYMPDSVTLADNYGPQTQAAVGRFHNANPQFAYFPGDPAIGPRGWAELHREAYS